MLFILFLIAGFFLYQVQDKVLAEQSGSSPESGVTSRIKTAYDWLVAKGANYGATDASDWSNNWGSIWNRIMESAAWEPDGTATEADVVTTKTFYAGNGDRTIKTGTAPAPIDWSTFSLQDYDNYHANDSIAEESVWINSAGNATTGVWKDTRTGLYWSPTQGSQKTNVFSRSICDFFSSNPRGQYSGNDNDCGIAINTCATLGLESTTDEGIKNDWYLPSQSELMIASIDGLYNSNSDFATLNYFWSSTEVSYDSNKAWITTVYDGFTDIRPKNNNLYNVRCVRRD